MPPSLLIAMKKTYCDRCGKEICYDPMPRAILPTYDIDSTYSFCQLKHFDLCGNCQIKLEKWLKEKKNDD